MTAWKQRETKQITKSEEQLGLVCRHIFIIESVFRQSASLKKCPKSVLFRIILSHLYMMVYSKSSTPSVIWFANRSTPLLDGNDCDVISPTRLKCICMSPLYIFLEMNTPSVSNTPSSSFGRRHIRDGTGTFCKYLYSLNYRDFGSNQLRCYSCAAAIYQSR